MDLESSHAATHIQDDSHLLDLVKEVLSYSELRVEGFMFEKDTGRIVGETDLVETNETDEIVFAKRKNRNEFTRFVKGKNPHPTSCIAIVLDDYCDGAVILLSAWIGSLAPPFPGDKNEKPESRSFWSNHALVWGKQAVDEKTITTSIPW